MNNSSPILVVDDSATQREVIRDALESRGYAVATARNGIEAITRIHQSPPALVLSDVLMPELNGYHLCRLLKSDPFTAHIPVLLLTNLRERHDRFWGEKAGADRYLEKTPDLTPILDAVAEFLPRSAHPRMCVLPGEGSDLRSEDIRSRVTSILDRLLYESTISNEILKLTGLAHDSSRLAREFLLFLSVICRYSMAALVIADGRDKYLLAFHLTEPVTEAAFADARQQTLTAAGLQHLRPAQWETVLVGEDFLDTAAGEPLRLLHSLPIADQGEFLAQLVLFHHDRTALTEGTRQALGIVADRFLIVARYLRQFKEIEQVKADFVSMLVHDLRSPLTSIRGFSNALAQGLYGAVNPDQQAALDNVESGCDRMLGLIGDILDLSKLEAGKLKIHLSPLHVKAVAERAVRDLNPLFQEKEIEVRLELDETTPYILADGKQLARVFVNLLANAANFTPTGGRVTISAAQPDPCHNRLLKNCLEISVTDTGEGIPTALQQQLFGRFQQLQGRGGFPKGTGLGLAICREIVSLHQGDIWVESPLADGRGSRFHFTLPLAE